MVLVQCSCMNVSVMDQPPRMLEQAKASVTSSTEWHMVLESLRDILEHYLAEVRRQDGILEEIPKQRLCELMRSAAKELQKTKSFRDLQSKVTASLAQALASLPSLVLLGAGDSASLCRPEYTYADTMINAEQACAYLLQEHCHLKHYLRKCFNHPLPPELRIAAWKALHLRDSAIAEKDLDIKQIIDSSDEVSRKSNETARKCVAIVSSSPFLSFMMASPTAMKALKCVVTFWSHCKGGRLSDVDILLCVPLLHVWYGRLEGNAKADIEIGSTDHLKTALADVVQVYSSIRAKFPLTASDVQPVHVAMDTLTQEVEDLLDTECPALYKHLVKVLGSHHSTQSRRSVCHVRLRKIIHQHVQRMFVGDMPTEVVCYIWDQCFIGQSCDVQCLSYYVTSWLVILKQQLLLCQNETDIRRCLSNEKYNLKIAHFQSEIENRFHSKISSHLKIETFPMDIKLPRHTEFVKQASAAQPVWSVPPPALYHHSRKHKQGDKKEQVISSQETTPNNRQQNSTNEKGSDEIQDHQSELLKQERKKHRIEVEHLTLELELLKKKIDDSMASPSITFRSEKSWDSTIEPSSSLISNTCTVAIVSQESDHSDISPHSSVSTSPASAVMPNQSLPPQIPTIPLSLSDKKIFSPNNLTKNDVTEIWLMIFKRFTSAVSLVCHGTGNERQELSSKLKQRISDKAET